LKHRIILNRIAKERHFLKAVALEEPESIYRKVFLSDYSLGTASSAQKAAKRLFDLDYIKKQANGKVSLVNPLLRQWIIRSDTGN